MSDTRPSTKEYETTNEERENNVNWAKVTYKVFVTLGMIAIIILIILRPCNCKCHGDHTDGGNQSTTIGYDENLDDGVSSTTTSVDELNKKVEQGMITMSMNTDPIFASGTEKGNLLIANDKTNNYPIMVEIKTKSDEKTIYKSGLIPVGKYVSYAKLSVDLPKGDYPCVAYFNNMDESTGEILGTGGAEITIHVTG